MIIALTLSAFLFSTHHPLKPAPQLCPGPVSPAVYVSTDIVTTSNYTVTADGSAYYSDCWGNTIQSALGGWLTVNSDTGSGGGMVQECETTINGSPWSGTVEDAADSFHCYDSFITAYCQYCTTYGLGDLEQEAYSGMICPTECDWDPSACDVECDPDYQPDCDCDPFTGICNLVDPIMINLDNGAWALTTPSDGVVFDIRASGHRQQVAWTAPGSSIAFLAVDWNNNGVIDNGYELFGNIPHLAGGQRSPNGFETLAQYDANGDGVIDANDPIWSRLVLWVDRNHDGISQPGEITPISATPITAIDLRRHWLRRRDSSGNYFLYEGHVHMGKRVVPFYDVFLLPAR